MKSPDSSNTKRKKPQNNPTDTEDSPVAPDTPPSPDDAASPPQKHSPWASLGTQTCKKLSPRGEGLITYEFAQNTEADTETFGLRIVSSGSSGSFSKEWLTLEHLKLFLETHPEKTLRSSALADVFKKSSNNNHGYLAAILVAENILKPLPETLAQFTPNPDGFAELTERLKAKKINHE
jgi:hypothetical protein